MSFYTFIWIGLLIVGMRLLSHYIMYGSNKRMEHFVHCAIEGFIVTAVAIVVLVMIGAQMQ